MIVTDFAFFPLKQLIILEIRFVLHPTQKLITNQFEFYFLCVQGVSDSLDYSC